MTFNKKVIIKVPKSTGEGSFADVEWVEGGTAWVRWINVHGSEVWASESVQALKAATVTMRYRTDINEMCRLTFNDVDYEIVSIDNVRQLNRVLEIKVRAAENG